VKKNKVLVETEQIIRLRRRPKKVRAWCKVCAKQVSMVSSEEAAALMGISQRTIFRQVEAGDLHFTETLEGLIFICPNSLHK
jgi:hypothetical protein